MIEFKSKKGKKKKQSVLFSILNGQHLRPAGQDDKIYSNIRCVKLRDLIYTPNIKIRNTYSYVT